MVKHPCGTCGKSASKDSIECNFCGLWHHAKPDCMQTFTKEQIAMLKELCKERTCWTCHKCAIVMKKLNGRLAGLEKSVDAVKKDVSGVREKQEATDKTVSELGKDVNRLKLKVDSNTDNVKTSVMSEVNNRELRKSNLIVYGLAEPVSAAAESREAMMQKDNAALNDLLVSMDIDLGIILPAIRFRRRLGQKVANKIRPLLLCFSDISCRNVVLERVPHLTGPQANKIKIRPDLTQMQRDDDMKIIKEVQELNDTEPKDELGDYRWRVVGPPGLLRRAKSRDLTRWKAAEELRKSRKAAPKPQLDQVIQEEDTGEEEDEEEDEEENDEENKEEEENKED